MSGPVEIWCDESGFTGSSVGNTAVFSHASIDLDRATAEQCLIEVRRRSGSSRVELKSADLRRAAGYDATAWLLRPDGPLAGHALVHLTETAYFVVARLVDLAVWGRTLTSARPGTTPDGGRLARLLYTDGPAVLGPAAWRPLTVLAVAMLRDSWQRHRQRPVVEFYTHLEQLRRRPDLTTGAAGPQLADLLARIAAGRPAVEAYRAGQVGRRRPTPLLEPLIPALATAVLAWGDRGRPVLVRHDEQSVLTATRMAMLAEELWPVARLLGVTRLDSRSDPRIQVADLLAGAARRIAAAELSGTGDPELTALLRPLTSPDPVWAGRCGVPHQCWSPAESRDRSQYKMVANSPTCSNPTLR